MPKKVNLQPRNPASLDLLRRLTLALGPPGAEDAVRAIVREAFDGSGEVSCDRLGSILCEKRGTSDSPRVVLDAHMDEVGFLVQRITDEGRLGFVPLGGWWGHVLLGQRVDILASGPARTGRGPGGAAVDGTAVGGRASSGLALGGSAPSGSAPGGSAIVPGVIGSKPPHFLSAAERDKVLEVDAMYIDIGASSKKEAEALGIRVGDPVAPHAEFVQLAGEVLSSKAFDNRAGVALLCETMSALQQKKHPNTVVGVGAVQEEVGCRGAGTATEMSRPDIALVLEGTPADDLPGFTERQATLGKGPQIRFSDPTALSNRRLVRFVEETARKLKIPVQMAVRKSGGTDARSIQVHGRGVPTVVIGVPARYIHTHVSLIHFQDYLAAGRLVLGTVLRLDADAVGEIASFR